MKPGYHRAVQDIVQRLRSEHPAGVQLIHGFSGMVGEHHLYMVRDKVYRMKYLLYPVHNETWKIRLRLDTMEFVKFGIAVITEVEVISGEEQFETDMVHMKMLLA